MKEMTGTNKSHIRTKPTLTTDLRTWVPPQSEIRENRQNLDGMHIGLAVVFGDWFSRSLECSFNSIYLTFPVTINDFFVQMAFHAVPKSLRKRLETTILTNFDSTFSDLFHLLYSSVEIYSVRLSQETDF